jgi:ankyrin repeat protein
LDLVKEIISRFPDSHKVVDESKRTPLHYAALHQQDSPVYKALFGAGADEKAADTVCMIFNEDRKIS